MAERSDSVHDLRCKSPAYQPRRLPGSLPQPEQAGIGGDEGSVLPVHADRRGPLPSDPRHLPSHCRAHDPLAVLGR